MTHIQQASSPNTVPENLLEGIRLVQAGQKAEALPFLRYAARNETIGPEGWLWLAAASDDFEEYRYCVSQALGLSPAHPIARQMQQALADHDRRSGSGYGFYNTAGEADVTAFSGQSATGYPGAAAQPPRRRRLRRVLLSLMALVVLGGMAALVIALITSDALQDTVDDLLSSGERHTLEFTVTEGADFRFRVDVPESWMPANTESPTWRDTRDALTATFDDANSIESMWANVEAAFSAAVRDPHSGRLTPSVRVVETDADRLAAQGIITNLTLQQIGAFEPTLRAETTNVCTLLEALEAEHAIPGPNTTILSQGVERRASQDDCALVVDRQIARDNKSYFPVPGTASPSVIREILIAIPVGVERYALWRLTLTDAAYDLYDDDIAHVIDTLEYLP